MVGALTFFLFLIALVPVPPRVYHDTGLTLVNVGLFVCLGPIITVFATRRGAALAEPVRRWFVSGEEPGPRERQLALRQPFQQAKLTALIWTAAAALFATINAFRSIAVGLQALIGIALGGVATCALVYLLAERFTREVTGAALANGAPEQPVGPGVRARLKVAWALAAGVPLLGAALLGISVLVVGHWSASRTAISLLILSAVGLALGWRAMSIAGRSLVDPIEAVRAGQRRVQAGDLTTEIPVYDGSELGLLQAGFNEMTAGLRERERIREAFGTYLDHDVAEHVLSSGTALELEVTAMFIDIRDFTGFAERSSATEVVAAINRLFERIVPIIHAHGGHIDKFVGDGLLAVFGAPRPQPNHADRALAAAIEIEHAVADELPIGIGVSSGSVIAGNVGGAGRFEFSVIGDAVNVAARVEEATRTTGDVVLVSAHTRALLSDASQLEGRPTLPLKGISESVALFAPRQARAPSVHQAVT